MADRTYIAWNGASGALTGALAPVVTGASGAIKTMLQLKSSAPDITIVEWGYSFDVLPTVLVKVELIDTGLIAATGTALSAAGVPAYSVPGGSAAELTYSTTTSCYSASAEGTITATRLLAYNEEWGQSFKQQFPLGREPSVPAANFLRIRATTNPTINMTCYIVFDQ